MTHPLKHAPDPCRLPDEADYSVVDPYLCTVAAREDVEVIDAVTRFDDRAEFEATRERARRLRGNALVVVADDDGQLLLVENDWMDGFGVPGGGVEPDT